MKVKFVPQDVEFEIQPNQTVKDLADEKGIFIKSICNGLPSCAECRVRVIEGEHNVLLPSPKEQNLIGNGYFIDQRRLSCQLLCFGDITVDLTEQVEKQKSAGSKRPQGSRKTEAEVSHAVTGNLIEQDSDLKNLAVEAPASTGGGGGGGSRERGGGGRDGGRRDRQQGGGRQQGGPRQGGGRNQQGHGRRQDGGDRKPQK